MIAIESTRVITYGNNQSVTVYRDFTDTNTWYIVPEPVIAKGDNGLPEFALVQYNGDGGQVAGTCTFQAELSVSTDALNAVQNALKGATFGQFDWQSVNAVFIFSTANMADMELTATPSMYGANRASFIIHLPDQATVNDFINAFGPDGSRAGTFMLRYDVTALTRLPPAKVTVQFNSSAAYDFQRTVSESKNVWGNVTSRTVAIHEHLAQSEAGTISVDPGGQPLAPDTRQKLEAWGNATLENDVNQVVGAALQIAGQAHPDNFSMSQVASFTNSYIEGQVVPWIITPRAPIPAFSKDEWAKLFSVVPNQNLAVAITVQNLTANDVASIDIVVTYPTRQTENTYSFTPDKPGSWTFTAPGNVVDGKYSPAYSYQYTVHYKSGEPYKSPVINSTDTAVYIDANDLNILKVTFDATNAFTALKDQVDYLLIDFYFVNQADGTLVQDEQQKLSGQLKSHTFYSKTKLPFANDYQYKLTYVLKTGQQVIIDWAKGNVSTDAGHKATAPVVTLNSPFQTRTVALMPIAPKGKSFDDILLMVTYTDDLNNLNEQNQWQVTPTQKADPWTFLAPVNKSVVVQYQGEYVMDGTQYDIQQAETAMLFIPVSSTQERFSVEVDPSQIEWDKGKYTQVVLNIYTKGADGSMTNIGSPPPFTPKNLGKYLWGFLFDTGKTPKYYYTAEYWIKDQPLPKKIKETTIQGQGVLTLPGMPPDK